MNTSKFSFKEAVMNYEFLNKLLSNKDGGVLFTCFGLWHLIYLALVFGATVFIICKLKDKAQEIKSKALSTAVSIAFGLYMADFFLMPFAYGEIDIDKLPFHACTSMCILSFAARHSKSLYKYRIQFALIGMIANIVYLVYPQVLHDSYLSYKSIQTLLFHGCMTAYGIMTLALDDVKPEWKKCYRELVLLAILTLWALLGNTLYSGELGDYSHNFNWFFVKRDPFGALDESISRYVMPFLTPICFFGMDLIIYSIYFGIKKAFKKKA